MQDMSTGKTALGLDANIGAGICNIPVCGINLIYSLIVLVTDKTNKLPRFHAIQSLLLIAAYLVLALVLAIVVGILGAITQSMAVASLGYLLLMAVIGIFILAMIFCAIKGFQGQIFKLPIIGDLADKWSN